MPTVRYSKRALADLDDIVAFTLRKWDVHQVESYVDDLYEAGHFVAEHPHIGRPCGPTHPKWRRIEHQSHVILYSTHRTGITVHRIMHKARLLR